MLEGMSGKIFINYRRGDEPGFAQALLGRLEQAFPAERLFMDVDNIPPGEDFVRMLESQVAQCDAMLTVIGNNWLGATDEHGSRRLDDPHDFVRIEIESALKQGKRVIPVLVHQARMPHPNELPEAMRPLSQRNAVRLTHERFRSDVQGLIKALQGAIDDVASLGSGAVGASDRGVKPLERPPSSRRALVTFGVLGIVLVGAVGIWLAYPQLTSLSHEAAPVRPTSVQPAPAPSTPVQPTPVRSTPAQDQASAAPVQPAPSVLAPPPRSDTATPPEPSLDATRVEVAFWNSIKDEKNPNLFEAYLKRYPNGAFADIARITLDELKAAARTPPPAPRTDDSVQISDPVLLDELRDRLYELNFDPGPLDGPLTDATRKAIQEFQQQINVPPTGIATMGLLRRLRELGGVKPWGSIVYGKDSGKWGMAWNENTRKAAVARARASCGDSTTCPVEVSFFGAACGAFAYSATSWAIAARDAIAKAKADALADCGKRGNSCQVIASVCADGAERFSAK
jgi:hypothetical protein